MQIFSVLRSGLFTGTINGNEETAQRTALLGSYTTIERANEVRETTPVGKGWNDVTVTWVDAAVLDEEPLV